MPREKFEINKEIVFSTCHVSKECEKDLSKFAGGSVMAEDILNCLSIYKYETGFRIHISADEPTTTTQFLELNRLMACAKLNRCVWLVLDCDGPEYDSFEKFDW